MDEQFQHRQDLWSLVPDPDRALALELSELAFYLLSCLRTLPEGELNLNNLGMIGEFTRRYPPSFKQRIDSAVSGAWSWLLGQGYLGQRPGSHEPTWVIITPQGQRWYEDEIKRRNASVDKSLEDPKPRLDFPTLGLDTGIVPSEDLARFLGLLIVNGAHNRNFDFTFTSMFMLFFYSPEPVAVWFQAYVKEATLLLDGIVVRSGLKPTTLDIYRSRPITSGEILNALSLRNVPTWSASSKTLIQEASKIAARTPKTQSPYVELRHLMAAYIYKPFGHEDQLRDWGFNREDWGSAFYRWSALRDPDEASIWLDLHQETFRRSPRVRLPDHESPASAPTVPVQDLDPHSSSEAQAPHTRSVGPSTHIARDKWTLDDALGYHAYAYAIYRFLTDADTAPPLAISIQAPWGGGKTSLMRMIQAQLDPDHPTFQKDVIETSGDTADRATVKHISDLIGGVDHEVDKGTIDVGAAKNRLTVWFNAWKYESTDQIWAGLADAIVKQVTERLSPVKRELFFFRLHLKRLDVAKIRRKIIEGILSKFLELLLRSWWIYLALPIGTYFVRHSAAMRATLPTLANFGPLGIILDFALLACQWFVARKEELETPAKVEFGDLVTAPDYDAKLGFIHQVSEDLKNTFRACKPSKSSPCDFYR